MRWVLVGVSCVCFCRSDQSHSCDETIYMSNMVFQVLGTSFFPQLDGKTSRDHCSGLDLPF